MNEKEHLFVGIVGSRRRSSLRDLRIVYDIVRKCMQLCPNKIITIVSGGAQGPDTFAANAARSCGLRLIEYLVTDVKNRYDFIEKAFARNRKIAEKSNILFALVADDRKGGTENTIKHMNDFNKPCYIVDEDGKLEWQ